MLLAPYHIQNDFSFYIFCSIAIFRLLVGPLNVERIWYEKNIIKNQPTNQTVCVCVTTDRRIINRNKIFIDKLNIIFRLIQHQMGGSFVI